ncbi:uncharacterized protein LOC143368493 [Andrena cerasifolii]|uniref:uncharacterized protein LOC143368493 n=1 Tax=Andrena cerasifolii TaxID=2819439 RepID=UPI004038146C
MDPQQWYLEEQLRRRESEVSELRGNLDELRTKFFQLERAFEINLQLQTRREVEFNRMKQGSRELQELHGETLQTRTELSSRLTNAITEKDHWKSAFLQQREFIKRKKIECDGAVGLVKRECEDILKMTRETAEKQFQELIELYNGAREKIIRLEEQIETNETTVRERENRTFELANLLETLKRFHLDVGSVCQLVAEALKNLTERGNLFEEGMKNLRHLAWTTEDRVDEPELTLLREQNSVLREVVKNLRKKLQVPHRPHNEIPERENGQLSYSTSREIQTNSTNFNDDLPTGSTLIENLNPIPSNSTGTLKLTHRGNYDTKDREKQNDAAPTEAAGGRADEDRKSEFDIESKPIDRRDRVLCIETHSNGLFYEEYIFKLSIDREIKVKYPVALNNNEGAVKMLFVDNESEYARAPLDGILMFFKNIYVSVNVKQTGVPCGTQTANIKTSNSSAQTSITGMKSFSRLNAGITVSKQFFRLFTMQARNGKVQ